MTLPDERYRAVVQTQKFLREILTTPRVPKAVKDQARYCLRHYPSEYDMKKVSQTSADIFQERMDDLHKFLLKGKEMKTVELMTENIEQLAQVSDEALDKAYHYGRSTPGANFGWLANIESAKAAAALIKSGETDIEVIADAIHDGWNITAIADYKGELQLDTPTPDEKKAKRFALASKSYAQLPEDEKEKDRVVARALLSFIKGV
jgi:excinuclease UvrABC nuclease subunit